MTHWFLSIVMLVGLAAGFGYQKGDVLQDQDQTKLQTRDKLKDGSCSTCPCR